MDFNKIIFPRPKPSYKYEDFVGNIIFIPRVIDSSFELTNAFRFSDIIKRYGQIKINKKLRQQSVPCLLYPY